MRWGVHGRVRRDANRDAVMIEVRTSGALFRWFLGINGAISQGLVLGLVLFGVAGTTDWPRAWAVIVVWSLFILLVCVLSSTEVLIERMWPVRDLRRMEQADLRLLLALGPLVMVWVVLMPLDRFHLELLSRPPALVAALGLVAVIVGCGFMTLSVRQNRFASPVVKLMEGQRVVDDGVYRIVRHPMYFGAVLFVIGLPLWLESATSVVLSIVLAFGLALRIRIEERVLAGLEGYDAYTHRVRHRLIPFVW